MKRSVTMQRPGVFLDRDGTMIEEVGYLSNPAGVRLLDGVAEAIKKLNEADIPVVVVTNQAGVGRGYFPESTVEAIHEELSRQLAARGARWDGIYYCPHHPDAGCDCRKPAAGLFLRAASEHALDLSRCFIVGDKLSDLRGGPSIGCRTILVLTGYGHREQQRCKAEGFVPDWVAQDLQAATQWLLKQVAPSKDVPPSPSSLQRPEAG